MEKNILRSHRARVAQANLMLKNSPKYSRLRISIIDREAFVEFLLLEDIVKLYEIRLRVEQNYIPHGQTDEMAKERNIAKLSAIIDIFKAAIEAAHSAIDSADYKKVWKSIPEGALMTAAKSIRHLPELKNLGIDMLRELCDGAEGDAMDKIEDVIRAAELAIPDKKKPAN